MPTTDFRAAAKLVLFNALIGAQEQRLRSDRVVRGRTKEPPLFVKQRLPV